MLVFEEVVKSIGIVFYEALCCKLFLNIFLKQRFSSTWIRGLSVCLLAGVFLCFALTTQQGGLYTLRCAGIIGSIFLFSCVSYSGKWLKRVFLSVTFYAVLVCVDYLGILIVDALLEETLLQNEAIPVILALLCKTVLFMLVLILNRFWKRGGKGDMNNKEYLIMICFSVVIVTVMLVMLLSFRGQENAMEYLTISVGMAVMNVVLFGLLKYISEREYCYRLIQLQQEQNEEKLKGYQQNREDYRKKTQQLHDYNNLLHCLLGLLRQGKYLEAEEYSEKLSGMMKDSGQVVKAYNPILDVMFNQKYRLAKSKGIRIEFVVNNLSGVWMEEQDMVILFSNLLDNAIEACEKLDDHKEIRFKLIREKRNILFSVQNPVKEPVAIQGVRIPTDKEDKENHGMGLNNIKMVLDKYHGMGLIQCRDGWFCYTAAIPMEEID